MKIDSIVFFLFLTPKRTKLFFSFSDLVGLIHAGVILKKWPRDQDFPAIFHLCRRVRQFFFLILEEAVSCFRVRQQQRLLEVFESFCYSYRALLKPSVVLFLTLCKTTG